MCDNKEKCRDCAYLVEDKDGDWACDETILIKIKFIKFCGVWLNE